MLKTNKRGIKIPLLVIPAGFDPVLIFSKLRRNFDTNWTMYQKPIFQGYHRLLDGTIMSLQRPCGRASLCPQSSQLID